MSSTATLNQKVLLGSVFLISLRHKEDLVTAKIETWCFVHIRGLLASLFKELISREKDAFANGNFLLNLISFVGYIMI